MQYNNNISKSINIKEDNNNNTNPATIIMNLRVLFISRRYIVITP